MRNESVGGTPTLMGIPWDASSSYLRGPAGAPPKIREAFHCEASNAWSESGIDLEREDLFIDAGDLTFESKSESKEDAFLKIESAVSMLLDRSARPILLGGDHSITFPIVQ